MHQPAITAPNLHIPALRLYPLPIFCRLIRHAENHGGCWYTQTAAAGTNYEGEPMLPQLTSSM